MSYLSLYIVVACAIMVLYLLRQRRIHRTGSVELKEAFASGLNEPPSLHPVIHPSLCVGSGACIKACPEGALGMVGGKAVLINAASCIGHGACYAACPHEAISLVFGTEKRGIDIPNVSPDFESNVPGIYVAGELGGMGLIRKAAEQGRQAIESLRKKNRGSLDYDVVIVGCGPAGISAGLAAIQHKLRYKLIEQEESLGGAVFHYPRQKVAMTSPVKLALVGTVNFTEVRKEKLLTFWQDVVKKTGLEIVYRQCMDGIDRTSDGFVVRTAGGQCYRTRSVLLTMGRRGTPRKLEVPGENSAKVTYRLIDPGQYKGQSVLIVGGGDSALEAAIVLAEEPSVNVTLSYRSAAFSRVKQKNRNRLNELQASGRMRVLLNSAVQRITERDVAIEHDGAVHSYQNDIVIVCAGGLLPVPLLQKIGIEFDTKYGTA